MWKTWIVLFSSVPLFAAPEEQSFESAGLKEVKIESRSGKVSITSTEGDKATVQVNKNAFSDRCKLSVNRKGSKLEIDVKGKGKPGDCNVDFALKVPKAVDVDLRVGDGNVDITGLEGELELKAGSGDFSADGRFSKVEAKTGSGKIHMKGLLGEAEFRVGSGSIDLTYPETPSPGELEIKIGSGDSTVSVPKGTVLFANFKGGHGKVTNELGDTKNAPFKIVARSGQGNLNVTAH